MTVSGMEDDELQRMAKIYLSTEDLTVETKRMMWLNMVADVTSRIFPECYKVGKCEFQKNYVAML